MNDKNMTVIEDNELNELKEKAKKWDRLNAITADEDCKGCPVDKPCKNLRYCIVEYILLSAEKTLEEGN